MSRTEQWVLIGFINLVLTITMFLTGEAIWILTAILTALAAVGLAVDQYERRRKSWWEE